MPDRTRQPSDAPALADALAGLATEQRDPALENIDTFSIAERCAVQNRLDAAVAGAVESELPKIAAAVETISIALRSGGRLFYIGAGTSGRLGVLDASECPPTFGTDPALVRGIIAGGDGALRNAVEGVEDDPDAGRDAIDEAGVRAGDVVVGITASGRTPYVLGALLRANALSAATIGLTNNRPSEIEPLCSGACIAPIVGAELIAGSTRLKAGTTQKLVLNMLTTQTMIELGKTYGNAMVDVMATNAKLKTRALRLAMDITGADQSTAMQALAAADGSVKVAIVMLKNGIEAGPARERLIKSGGHIRAALDA